MYSTCTNVIRSLNVEVVRLAGDVKVRRIIGIQYWGSISVHELRTPKAVSTSLPTPTYAFPYCCMSAAITK